MRWEAWDPATLSCVLYVVTVSLFVPRKEENSNMVIALGDLFALESIHFRIKGRIKTLAPAAKQSQPSCIPEREQRLWSPVEPSYCFPTGQNSPVLASVICPSFLFIFSPTFLYFNKISVLVTVGEICKSRELTLFNSRN